MAIDLTDDGTMDTLLLCSACGEVFRFHYEPNGADLTDPPEDWEVCGSCGGYHPAGFTGDCRDDVSRWASTACIDALADEAYAAWVEECAEQAEADHECPAYAPAVESLQTRGFDTSYATTDGAHVSCSQCQTVAINCVACHETGCPHVRRMDEED